MTKLGREKNATVLGGKMKKIKFHFCFWIVIILLALLGVLIAMIFDSIYTKYPSYFSVNLFQGIFIFFLSVWVSTSFHELIHVLFYKLNGIKIRLLYIFPMCFTKEKQDLKVSLHVNLILGFGGIVIPSLPPIGSHKDKDKILKTMRVSLISAPIFSAILGAISLFMAVCFVKEINVELQSFFFLFFIINILVSIYINIMSLLSFAGIIGDYAAFYMLKNNKAYSIIQLYNEYLLQDREIKLNFRKEKYLYNIVLEYLNDNYLLKPVSAFSDFNPEICNLLDIACYENIVTKKPGNEKLLNEIIFKVIDNDLKYIEDNLHYESHLKLLCHMIIFMFLNDKGNEAIDLWNKCFIKIPNSKMGNYCISQIESLINKKSILSIDSKIYLSSFDSLLSTLENYYDDEKSLNQKLFEG